jgi:hypothetical protein
MQSDQQLNTAKMAFLTNVTRKELLPVWLFIFVLIISDLLVRFSTVDVELNAQWQKAQDNSEASPVLSKNHYDEIIKQLTLFSGPEKPPKANNIEQGMSDAEQLAQQGDLNELYAKNFRYRLMGIIEQNYRFAVILQENLLTKKQEVIKVKELESLMIYNIKKIFDDKVTIVGNDKEINLFLYKTNNQSE